LDQDKEYDWNNISEQFIIIPSSIQKLVNPIEPNWSQKANSSSTGDREWSHKAKSHI